MPLVLTRRLQPLRGLLDLAPIVTVVLLLLFFFLLSSSFILQPGIKVDPPKAGFSGGTPSSRLIVAIALAPAQTGPDGILLKRDPVLYFNDQMVTLDGLRTALDQLPPSRTTPALIVKADKDVSFDLIASIMDIAVHHRPQLSVVLATQPAEATGAP